MDQDTRVGLKLSLPAGYFLLLALALGILGAWWSGRPYLYSLTPRLYQAAGICLIVAAAWGVYGFVRYYRWTQGRGLLCRCGGLLGKERPGVRDRSDYRKCLACGRNVPQKEYA